MITLNIKPIEQITIDVGVVTKSGGGFPKYEGSYEITPKTTPQTLETSFRSLYKDIEVKEIPAEEVSNIHGTTFIIGGN